MKIFRKKKEPKKIFEGSLEDVEKEMKNIAFDLVEKFDKLRKYVVGIKGVSIKDSKISINLTEREDIEIGLNLTILLKRK